MKSGWTGGMTNSTETTVKLGEDFAKFIEVGDVFAFIGELASGKTTFIKG
ncbi:MAG TPA: tRNA (adenosine(37)-N6)-threonylcarbamoyltransferase complex ATPase subunit type 1 TsaE, partial [Candidatus Marinimicrobia bacterium]|nr:tRNA (adenosine(37)-N6)-threonylcarbamoyltransferase complex ATPase subunit type 1 TsaE [Candidatus Neomarinimicrobiota bacterium]